MEPNLRTHHRVIEQVMRLTDDETLLLPWLDAPAGSRSALVALGRLRFGAPFVLDPDSPLAWWAAGETAPATSNDLSWVERLPVPTASMWAELELLEQLAGRCHTDGQCGPYQRLMHARRTVSEQLESLDECTSPDLTDGEVAGDPSSVA
jgi:hypothetical protein